MNAEGVRARPAGDGGLIPKSRGQAFRKSIWNMLWEVQGGSVTLRGALNQEN